MTTPSSPPSSNRFWKNAFFIVIAMIILLLVSVLLFLWWNARPIKATHLNEKEQIILDQKVNQLTNTPPSSPIPSLEARPPETSRPAPASDEPIPYEKGSKQIILTERELNGLLNKNSSYGETLQFQLSHDAIHLRVHAMIPEDFPIAAGKPFKARARIFIRLDEQERPSLIIDDVTLWGVSLPDAWLGSIKGKNIFNLLGQGTHPHPISAGIKTIQVRPGKLLLELHD